MSEMWRWLLDLERIPASADTIRLGWERAPAPWIILAIFFFTALLALWSYSGLVGSRIGRGAAATARAAILFGLALLACGPQLVVPQETVEPDHVLYLLDRSASMMVADASDGAGTGRRVARDVQMRDAIAGAAEAFAKVRTQHQTVWLGFDAGDFDLTTDDMGMPTIPEATGTATAIGPAIEQALARVSGKPVSGVVIFTDGRTTEAPDRALLRRLGADAIQVFAVPLGSEQAIADLAVAQVDAPARAFLNDKVPVVVRLERSGGAEGAWPGGDVVLRDADTGKELARSAIEAGAASESAALVTLVATPAAAGAAHWTVEVEPSGADLVETNNSAALTVDLVERPLKVLYIDGYPRWEYRYLKNLLVREASIDSSVFLLSADRDFAQEGNMPITRLPATAEEMEPYDVVILGDVAAGYFGPGQLEIIANHVAQRGAGLMWIAGERDNPASFATSALAPLIPLTGALTFAPLGEAAVMTPTALAKQMGVLQITKDGADAWPLLSDPGQGWTALRWALRIETTDLKPTAEVLAHTLPSAGGEGAHPLVAGMRFGAGQSIFVATDEIWRWRFGQGELYPEQFYLQLIRMLGRDRLAVSGRPAVLSVDPRRSAPEQPVVVDLRILDSIMLQSAPQRIVAQISGRDRASGEERGVVQEIELRPSAESPGRYTAAFIPHEAGEYVVQVRDPLLSALDLSAPFAVERPDDELRFAAADHALLAELAEATGGAVVPVGQIDRLPELLPNRTLRTPTDITESIWDTPLTLIVLGALLTLEWVGRKLLSLV